VHAYLDGFSDDDPGWQRARGALEGAAAAGGRRGIPLVLVVFPLFYRLDEDHPFAAIHDTVARTGRELGFHVLDLLPAFRGRDARSLWVHPSNQHPNELAHELTGREIHPIPRRRGLGRPLSSIAPREPSPDAEVSIPCRRGRLRHDRSRRGGPALGGAGRGPRRRDRAPIAERGILGALERGIGGLA